jgi:polygalacturonase
MNTNIFDIRHYGAVGDGINLSTNAVNTAAKACSDAGGGTVLVSGGDYVIGSLQLFNNTTLKIDGGAVLRGSRNIEDYEKSHLIWADKKENIVIEGPGLIMGEGLSFLLPPEAPRETKHPGIIDTEQAIDMHFKCKRMRAGNRPSPMIYLTNCDGVEIKSVRIEDAGGWTLSLKNCDNVNITAIRMKSDYNGVSVDGIDLTGCQNVVVSGCHIHTADDAIVLKNPYSETGRTMHNIIITGCTLLSSTNGIKIGTETYHDIEDIIISNCTIYCREYWPSTLTGISLESVDGANVSNIIVNNIVMRGIMTPFFLRLGNRGRGRKEPVPGRLEHISVSNIRVLDCDYPSSVTGIPSAYVKDVTIGNISIIYRDCSENLKIRNPPPEMEEAYPESIMFGDLPAYGLYARHVNGLKVTNVSVTPRTTEKRQSYIWDDIIALEENHNK